MLEKDIAQFRENYQKGELQEKDLLNDPIQFFKNWLEDAIQAQVHEPNAMVLATSSDGRPSARIVLLKGFDERGFVFYTNYESRKGQQMADNPWAALTFWWAGLERQVRIEGNIEKVSAEESDTYFWQRGKGSQIGAWASNQSREISSRDVLDARVEELEKEYAEADKLPRPPHWGGYRVKPVSIEFWQGRESRLHDRILFEEKEGSWSWKRLAP